MHFMNIGFTNFANESNDIPTRINLLRIIDQTLKNCAWHRLKFSKSFG
jgi:hypothetical protein